MTSKVKVRFPPSPTGFLHIGGARTALYNWLFARHNNGEFILRIEDTDRQRSTEEATQAILDSLTWLGLDWDEGPYHQSKRLEIYSEHVEKLLKAGKAFHVDDPEKGRAVRFKLTGELTDFDDLVHGNINSDTSLIEDFVIQKADGFPTYNFACVVDDGVMGITHVIRGDDHLSNTPRQVAIYKALGFELPKFAHIPMILGEDGSRMSKRHGATSVTEYRENGYLPDALVNFIALLGWSPGHDQELLTRQEMTEKFTLKRVNKTSARFDYTKLDWMNSKYIQDLPVEDLVSKLRPYIKDANLDNGTFTDEWLYKLVELYKERFRTLPEFATLASPFFTDKIEYEDAAVQKHLKKSNPSLMRDAYKKLKEVKDFSSTTELEDCLRSITTEHSVGFGKLAQPIRVAITGKSASAGIFETLELLGKEKTLKRLEYTINTFL
ncbi:MAG: Glutamate--tRNA ligase 2 [Candidatus Scalindua arabica]|uniref:Glutamate--tRNA ligase n=1 Tax=Candidatus Scalindua arabica TaxID=1127984 RepID=A0A941W158_9BACT|nr:Glutamate--tRNA ligase 2 [Candidatus Scalindua arabica]